MFKKILEIISLILQIMLVSNLVEGTESYVRLFLFFFVLYLILKISQIFQIILQNFLSYIFSFFQEEKKVLLKDVIIANEIKKKISFYIDMINHPEEYIKKKVDRVKGILLSGKPGTGKTLLARAIANEADCKFFYYSCSQVLSQYVSLGAKNIRNIFDRAAMEKKSIVFFDEIDAFTQERGLHNYHSEILNELLSCLDGLDNDRYKGIWFIAATNRPDRIDKALLRSGRIDRNITFNLPSSKSREELLKLYTQNIQISDVNFKRIAQYTEGLSGADIKNIINTAKMESIVSKKDNVDHLCFEKALINFFSGEELDRSSTQEDEYSVAIHEAGHAFMALFFKKNIFIATIKPYQDSAGHVVYFSSKEGFDEAAPTSKEIIENIFIGLSGKISEEVFLKMENSSIGCYSDLDFVRKYAEYLVNFGLIKENYISAKLDEKGIPEERNRVYLEAVKIINKYAEEVRKILLDNKKTIQNIAENLVKYKVLSFTQIKSLIFGSSSPFLPSPLIYKINDDFFLKQKKKL